MLQGFPTPSKYKVLVRCNTFNQSKYIEDTLKGICMQQTNFPFLAYVIDDASTDGEQDILKKWIYDHCNSMEVKTYDNKLAIILMAKDKDNENCIYAFHLLKKNLYMKPEKQEIHSIWREQCEYEALCEGDDYWIDESKLRTQISFLDNNKDFSVCSHRIERYDQDTKQIFTDNFEKFFKDKEGVVFKSNMPVWLAETCSVVFRNNCLEEYVNSSVLKRDVVQIYYLLKHGKGMCLNRVMSVYRQNQGGIFAKQSVKKKYIDGTYKTMKNLYDYEKNSESRKLYYKSYAYTFVKSYGRILFMEKFDLLKFLSLFFYIPSMIFSVHPAYILKK